MPMGAEPSGAEDHGRRSTPLTGCASDARPAGCRQQPWMMSWKDVGKAGLLTEASRGDFGFCLHYPWEEAVLTHRFFTIADDLDSYRMSHTRAHLIVKPAVRVSPSSAHPSGERNTAFTSPQLVPSTSPATPQLQRPSNAFTFGLQRVLINGADLARTMSGRPHANEHMQGG